MLERKIIIINKLGLHARAAAKFVSLTGRFTCDIQVRFNGQQVNGKSIMSVMMLAASQNSELNIIFDGEDEVQACEDLTALIEDYFGEGE